MSHLFSPLIVYSITIFICILIAVSASQGKDCGGQGFELKCDDSQFPTIYIESQKFRVWEIKESPQLTRIARADILGDFCSGIFQETIIDQNLFSYSENVRSLSLFFDCDTDFSSRQEKNIVRCPSEQGFYTIDGSGDQRLGNLSNSCSRDIKIPFQLSDINNRSLLEGKLKEVLDQGFELKYNADNMLCRECKYSEGICGPNQTLNASWCLCRDEQHTLTCPPPRQDRDPNLKLKLIIGFAAALGGMAIMAAAFLVYLRHNKSKRSSALFSRNTGSDPSSKSDLEKGDNFLGVHVFTYTELEEATNYFDSTKELGDGGFGTVYYGELQDGRAVAVKRLYENNYKRVEQFMNEVEILARLRHRNLVSLYGCTSRHSRELLLVYEYIPNGTVADHLHGERAKPRALPWTTRLKIAIETASALTYLHASDIIHRDVKTNNILLDSNFCVKVADFGLSRLFPNHVTHVSTAPQGTPGYVDPEYHQCYQLTEKSDVFSFGVVMIELISSMVAVDITRRRDEINLSNLAINKIQNNALHELVDPTLGYESDSQIMKTINAVAELAFQCLQSEKELRPYMADVLETLKDIESDEYNKKKTEELLTKSPVSVTHNWPSTTTTSNSIS